jgi:NADH-quinone oxidoreductase subunit J
MTISLLLFYAISGMLLLSATMVILARHPVHAVLFLILCFFNAAALFIFLGAELLSMILMIVYVGAVAVLFLFVVMMIKGQGSGLPEDAKSLPMAGLIGLVLLTELAAVVFHWKWGKEDVLLEGETSIGDSFTNSESIGMILYTKYALLLEIAGVILLVAMIGAIVLTLREPGKGGRRPSLKKQLSRRREDAVEIKKISPSEKLS